MLPLPISPRAMHRLIVVRALVSSVMLGGCVEATAYEQATSAAEVQGEGRRRLAQDVRQKDAELGAMRKERAQLKAENARLRAELAERQGAVDEAELELVLAEQEKSAETQLVQQLRGDLARVGSHLDAIVDEKEGHDAELETLRADNARLTDRLLDLQEQVENDALPAPPGGDPAPSGAAESKDEPAPANSAPKSSASAEAPAEDSAS